MAAARTAEVSLVTVTDELTEPAMVQGVAVIPVLCRRRRSSVQIPCSSEFPKLPAISTVLSERWGTLGRIFTTRNSLRWRRLPCGVQPASMDAGSHSASSTTGKQTYESVRGRLLGGKAWKARMFVRCLRGADALICQTNSQQLALKGNYGIDARIVPNGHVIPDFDEAKFDRCTARPSVLWVGRVHPMKRPMLFLDIAERLPNLRFTMVMAPCPEHGRLFADVKSRCEGIRNLTFIPGLPPTALEEHYRTACAFVLTSEAEGYSNVLAEAFKYQVPVVSLKFNPDNILTLPAGAVAKLPPSHGFATGDDPVALSRAAESVCIGLWILASFAALRT